ncbi:exopolysaccharide biosynthesis polyprenyl glycosylphosphotransferase [uncultured Nonlabens sp.]|uniref:exopolysaccharide biosynthesis polyprenyl glycosylphosphotransferase n=1 Tax=uncultured Nonlabens sp. TaxID=859306 RepID=UPI002628B328|nr:exopolysaccharide biosynthesis polyprenyl glycosylphosphotransferase [uncultured Nonlabens sp.]
MTTRTLQNISADSIAYRNGRFSGFIRPISYIVDLGLIIFSASYFFVENFDLLTYSIFIGICWIIVSMQLDFYKIRRNTKLTTLLMRLAKQSVFFGFVVFAFFGYYYDLNRESTFIFNYIAATVGSISIIKISLFFILKNYRSVLGGNYRNVAILGVNEETERLNEFFKIHTDYGYRAKKVVDVHSPTFSIDSFLEWVVEYQIDEIFCSIKELSNEQLLELTDFADNNLRTLKFIPDREAALSKQLHYDYYGLTPVLSLREIPLDDVANKFGKRAFDIIFSLLIILFVMSWLTPVVAVIIKLESKGSVFFKQARNGLDYKEFICYKFRSMVPNKTAHLHQVTRGDLRITKIGKFLRKTSIDELPQFFNVLLGDMSVVGPRPHMVSHTHMYAERIDKFMVRHFVKPGITGLAQVSGYRGEVETEEDIKGRVRNDIYYIENWNIAIDIKIIFKTIVNVFQGEEKAY